MSKTVIFYDQAFPYQGERPSAAIVEKLADIGVLASAEELARLLEESEVESFVNLHGPYFPKDCWNSIIGFLEQGKGMVHAGGAPFRIPLFWDEEQQKWQEEVEQTAYLQQLYIHEALPVATDAITYLEANAEIPLFSGKEDLFSVQPTYGLILHSTKYDDHPAENGSSGPMDAHIYPLLKGISEQEGSRPNRERSAPAVLLENTKGEFAGGRWLFVNQELQSIFWNERGLAALQEWSEYVSYGVTEVWLKPNYASFYPGEQPSLSLQLQQVGSYADFDAGMEIEEVEWSFELQVIYEKDDRLVWQGELKHLASSQLSFSRIDLPFQVEAGYYRVECQASSSRGEKRSLRQGFWGFDQELLSEGSFITVNRDYFEQDGRPLPIVGMTYMTSDVARKFMFMPNAAVWDKDMAQMRNAGINMIRTGIWTAYRQVMFIDGHPSEEVLRAIDAFILTAKKNDLELNFTFFGFTPETWEGSNPYLDPRSVEAQKRLIAAIVSRHKESKHLHWDLINEPSMFDPKRVFSGPRSAHDAYERKAYIEWLEQRHGSIRNLQESWNMTPAELPSFASVELPEQSDINFDITDMAAGKRGVKWLDYCLFTMEMHNRWVRQLSATIKSINPQQLITVGQDEALGSQRPSPFFYADDVDYTTNHSWWMMDQLLWDGIFTKAPYKPNLIQETGMMYVEQPDGKAKRSEEELRNILERKYAYSFAAGGAGAIQWIWNINFYMHNINESNIGAVRADGTEKPEANVSYDFGQFIAETRDLFVERKLEDIVAIFPYSNDFSNRKLAFEATTKLARVFGYTLKTPIRALGEYHLEALEDQPAKLIIVPSAHNFSDVAFERIISYVEQNGATLLFTGPLGIDEYWRYHHRLEAQLGATKLGNILREEMLQVDGANLPFSFGGRRIAEASTEFLVKEAGQSASNPRGLVEVPLGQGKLIWAPLPIELADNSASIAQVYRYAMQQAGVEEELEWLAGKELAGVYGRKLSFQDGAVYTFISEYGYDASVRVRDKQSGKVYSFVLERERSVLFATNEQGEVTSIYRAGQVHIDVE